MQAFARAEPEEGEEEGADYFLNHPLFCKELTPEMMEKPEFQALQELAYDGTPEEVCRNFKDHAFEALTKVIKK